MLLLVLGLASAALEKKSVMLAVYPAPQAYTTRGGISFQSDEKYVKGVSNKVDYSTSFKKKNIEIRYTNDPSLFHNERHSYEQLNYELPIGKQTGTFTVVMKMAEMYFEDVGKRVFDIYLGDDAFQQEIDIISKVGKHSVLQVFMEINVKLNGMASIKGKIYQNAIQKGKIMLSLRKGKADNPIINAIMLLRGGKEKVELEYKHLVKTWKDSSDMRAAIKEDNQIKERLARQKNKHKVFIRNDQLSSLQEIPQISVSPSTPVQQKTISLTTLLKSTPGSIAQLIVLILLLYKLKSLTISLLQSEPIPITQKVVSQQKEQVTTGSEKKKKKK